MLKLPALPAPSSRFIDQLAQARAFPNGWWHAEDLDDEHVGILVDPRRMRSEKLGNWATAAPRAQSDQPQVIA